MSGGYPYVRAGRGGAGGVRFKRRKSRFSFEEVQLMLSEVKRHRHILVGKFNSGVASDIKKRTWAAITARINEISECQREILEIIKKWSDLKCDTKRKVAAMRASGATSARIARDLSPIESMVHQILQMPVNYSTASTAAALDDDGDEDFPMMPPMPRRQAAPTTTTRSPRRLLPGPPPPAPAPVLALAPPGPPQPPRSSPPSTKNELGLPTDMMYTRNSPHPLTDFQFESPDMEDSLLKYDDGHIGSERSHPSSFLDPPPPPMPPPPRSDTSSSSHRGFNGSSMNSSSPAPPPPPISSSMPMASTQAGGAVGLEGGAGGGGGGGGGSSSGLLGEQLAQSASLSLQEQQAATALMGSISRSLEVMSESVQQLVETQQAFARDSLQMQRDALHVLRDFTSGALALLQDKLNGRPLLQ